MRVASWGKRGFLLKPLSFPSEVKEFLINNPFVFIEKSNLNSAVFIDESKQYSNDDFESFEKKYRFHGFKKHNIYSIDMSNGRTKIQRKTHDIIE